MGKRKPVTVTMKLNKNGTMTLRSTGGFDLRKIMPRETQGEEAPAPLEPTTEGQDNG